MLVIWLVVTVIFALGVYFLGQPNTLSEVFLSATKLLFWLCLISSLMWLAVMVIFRIVFSVMKPTLLRKGMPLQVFTFLAPGYAVKSLAKFVIFSGSLVVGAYLLHNSVVVSAGGTEWNVIKLAAGGILLVVGLIKGGGILGFNMNR